MQTYIAATVTSWRARIPIPMSALEEFCRRWRVVRFSLFGSVLRSDFNPESDVDVLVDFEPHVRRGLFDVMAMEDELRELVGRPVDVLTRRGVEVSGNQALRDSILRTAEVIYVHQP